MLEEIDFLFRADNGSAVGVDFVLVFVDARVATWRCFCDSCWGLLKAQQDLSGPCERGTNPNLNFQQVFFDGVFGHGQLGGNVTVAESADLGKSLGTRPYRGSELSLDSVTVRGTAAFR